MWDETPSTSLEQYPETSSSEQRPQKHLVLSTTTSYSSIKDTSDEQVLRN